MNFHTSFFLVVLGGLSTSSLLLHWTVTQAEAEQPPPKEKKKKDDVLSGTHRTWLRTAGVSEHGASTLIRIAGGRLEI